MSGDWGEAQRSGDWGEAQRSGDWLGEPSPRESTYAGHGHLSDSMDQKTEGPACSLGRVENASFHSLHKGCGRRGGKWAPAGRQTKHTPPPADRADQMEKGPTISVWREKMRRSPAQCLQVGTVGPAQVGRLFPTDQWPPMDTAQLSVTQNEIWAVQKKNADMNSVQARCWIDGQDHFGHAIRRPELANRCGGLNGGHQLYVQDQKLPLGALA
jgi:hypothetical protein